MDEINEHTDNMRAVNDALAEPIGMAAEFDEDELDAELNELEALELDQALLQVRGLGAGLGVSLGDWGGSLGVGAVAGVHSCDQTHIPQHIVCCASHFTYVPCRRRSSVAVTRHIPTLCPHTSCVVSYFMYVRAGGGADGWIHDVWGAYVQPVAPAMPAMPQAATTMPSVPLPSVPAGAPVAPLAVRPGKTAEELELEALEAEMALS
jgi:hypothetical protein